VALALSPDGQQALLLAEDNHLDVVPVGAGRTIRLAGAPLEGVTWAAFVPGSPRIVALAKGAGKGDRLYAQDLAGGEARPISAEGVSVYADAISPDGAMVAARHDGKPVLIALDGGAVRDLAGLPPGHRPMGWTGDGGAIFVRGPGLLPVPLLRYDLSRKKLDPWRALTVVDPAGVLGIGRISLARDGEICAYEIYRLLSDLYIIENLG
jgi:hypothetical protein